MIDILEATKSFYSVEAIEALLVSQKKFVPFRHSHERWYTDFLCFKNLYINNFATAIYDYTAIVVAGELRHGYKHSNMFITDFFSNNCSREDVFQECRKYDPQSILQTGEFLFDNAEWEGGYGGLKWASIAKAGLLWQKINKEIFIDHCVDLAHNNSIYFDKGGGIFDLNDKYEYQKYLNFRKDRETKPERLLEKIFSIDLFSLIERGKVLGIFSDFPVEPIEDEYCDINNNVIQYCPVLWGQKRIPFDIKNGIYKPEERRRRNEEEE